MPRQARIKSSTGIYHIMIRGNEKKEIFKDNSDRIRFLDTLQKMREDANYSIYAYCLMNNHVHLLIREGEDSIQRSMKRICVSYVAYFNNKYERIGHLFQDRFKSEAVENEPYALAAARYIHNNPVKGGMVSMPEDYEWSSYKEYIDGIESRQGLVERNFLLSILSDSEGRAAEMFAEFTKQSTTERFIDCDEDKLKPGGSCRRDLRAIVEEMLEKYGHSLESIRKSRNKNERNEVIRAVKEKSGVSVRELSLVLGVSKDVVFRS